MATARKTPETHARLLRVEGGTVLVIEHGRLIVHYHLTELVCDFGRGFRLEKFAGEDGECYDVLLERGRGQCECKGFYRWGHCKHITAIVNLLEGGEIV